MSASQKHASGEKCLLCGDVLSVADFVVGSDKYLDRPPNEKDIDNL